MEKLGCHAGTVADRPFIDPFEDFERCPLAILRDMTPDESAGVSWAINMAVAKRQGSLAAFISPGMLSAQGQELIHVAEEVMEAREEEHLDAITGVK